MDKKLPSALKYKVGDIVISIPPEDATLGPQWNIHMNKFLGVAGYVCKKERDSLVVCFYDKCIKTKKCKCPFASSIEGEPGLQSCCWHYLTDWLLPFSEKNLSVAKLLVAVKGKVSEENCC